MPFLGEVPIVQSIREGGDAGVPAVLDQNSIVGNIFSQLSDQVARQVAIRNANIPVTEVVKMN